MRKKQNAFYTFLSLTRGDCRNSIYIECKFPCCPECKGYFMVSDTEGVPMFFSVSLFEKMTNLVIDKNECAAILSKTSFDSVYNRWLIWNVADKNLCSIKQVMTNLQCDKS